MGKHSSESVPRTGTGEAGGHGPKPAKGQVSETTEGGAVLWKGTAGLFKNEPKTDEKK